MPTEHRITTDDGVSRSYWECDCGQAGSVPFYGADVAADKHIDYVSGDTRIDVRQ